MPQQNSLSKVQLQTAEMQNKQFMNGRTCVVLGATGLIGSSLVEQLLKDDTFSAVRVLVRRPFPLQHPRLEVKITDFSDYEVYKKNLGTGDCIFSCIGTTNADVKGDKALYRSIDFDIPVNAARFGSEAGFKQFLLVSAIGADADSRIFYSRLKGEVEEVIATFPFEGLHIFRPSFLVGNRKQKRMGEGMGTVIFRLFSFLIPSKYKAIEGKTVATAMLAVARKNKTGLNYYQYNEMVDF
jgi:uncharacterized protein YbjT (DUF2867 family)